ncbi:hypothetical protein J1N35_006304 [Gossypium stocksii]|uniref:Uncharacterized protein n=1 Tax=Gossypium stocksii TaxID=47602 RepID=A0A9D3WFN0_9ROSI|nr:hypothetical protein J1N35_006304 [Gossypium stocksii]
MVCRIGAHSSEILEESSASPRRVSIQDSKVNVVLPALGSDDPEAGTEALTQVVREVLEKVFEASLERTREMVQGSVRIVGRKEIAVLRG